MGTIYKEIYSSKAGETTESSRARAELTRQWPETFSADESGGASLLKRPRRLGMSEERSPLPPLGITPMPRAYGGKLLS